MKFHGLSKKTFVLPFDNRSEMFGDELMTKTNANNLELTEHIGIFQPLYSNINV